LLFGACRELGVKGRGHPHEKLSTVVGHLTHGIACGTIQSSNEMPRQRANAPGPATEVRAP
jgi:hypothetical protein